MNLKLEIYNACTIEWKNKQIELLKKMDDLEQSLFNESKSSAGDKYETSRAMLHLEKEKLDLQMIAVQQNIKILSQIYTETPFKIAKLGSLVQTQNTYFYLSVSCPKWSFQNKEVYCISPQSPLAQSILGKKVKESFIFNQQILMITNLF